MTLELVSVLSTDKLLLPGLLYFPDQKTSKAAVWLHGMSSSVFYNPELMNDLGKALASKDIALLTLNNRGAYPSKRLKIIDDSLTEEESRYPGGSNFELIADCVKDIDGAAKFLKDRGYAELYLLGHSTGANKICAYHARVGSNPFSRYVLAGSGDDIGVWFNQLGPKRFWSALRYAAARITQGDPLHVMPKYSGMYPYSTQSAHELLNPDGPYNTFPYYEAKTERLGRKPLFEEYREIDKPTLVIFGENDEYAATAGSSDGAREILMKHTSNAMLKKVDFQIVPNTDHSFHDAEAEFAKRTADWLAR